MKKILFIFMVFLFGTSKVNAVTNPYGTDFNGQINCTWFAWQQAYDKAGVALPGWGNANTWLASAQAAGYETGMTPRVNSIVVWQWNNLGHVGYVERVYGDRIYVWDSVNPDGCPAEMPDLYHCWDNHTLEEVDNGACDGVSTAPHGCAYHTTYWHNEGDLIGYIYLDNAPATPIISTPIAPEKPGVSNDLPQASNNAYLSNIKISNIDFEFNKDILEYELEVENDIEDIDIEATAEDNNAKVDGAGKHKLNIGENNITLTVMAEDGSTNTYTLKINRKESSSYLSSLTISNIDFNFKKDVLKYEVQVARDIKSVIIDGKSESSLATIDGLGTYEITKDVTTIKIKVTAKDETTTTYTITLKKENVPKKKLANKKLYVWIITGTAIAVCIISIITFFIIKKKKK